MSRSLVKTLGFYGPFAWAAPTFVFGVLPVAMALKRLHPGAEPLLWRVAQRYYRFFLANLERLGAIALDVRHAERAHVSRPAVYVANHRTLIDVLLLLSQVPRATCLLKSTAIAGASPDESGLPRGRMPAYWSAYITAAVRGLGYVPMPGDWTDHHALLRVLRECQAGLEAGRPLIIFPEGTRSPGTHLLPFLDLPFKVAVDARVPVAPVVIHADRPFMPKGRNSIDAGPPARFTLEFLKWIEPGPRIRTKDLSYESRRAITRRLRQLDRESSVT